MLSVRRAGNALSLSLPALPPSPAPLPEWAGLVGGLPTGFAVHPGRYNVLLFASADEVLALKPDFKALAALGDHQFICTAPGRDTDVISRVFVPGAGVDEDSVTGSAHAVLTPFWAERLGRSRFTAFQASQRGGLLHCTSEGDRAVLAGKCFTVVTGTFRLR
jgi:predicted PhzF superfamily epimerase YddE/YHI9